MSEFDILSLQKMIVPQSFKGHSWRSEKIYNVCGLNLLNYLLEFFFFHLNPKMDILKNSMVFLFIYLDFGYYK